MFVCTPDRFCADRILVIDNGVVVENGNHQDLLTLNGIDAELHRLRLGHQELPRTFTGAGLPDSQLVRPSSRPAATACRAICGEQQSSSCRTSREPCLCRADPDRSPTSAPTRRWPGHGRVQTCGLAS